MGIADRGRRNRWPAVAFCFLAVSAFGTAFAQTDPSVPPVQIDNCAPIIRRPDPFASNVPTFMGIPIASTSTGMRITFVNQSRQVAKLVNFAVQSNGSRFIIRDVGTFSPGISIVHEYRNGAGQGFVLPAFIAPNVTCRVSMVEFADGSVWRRGHPPIAAAPAAPPTPTRRLAVTPARLDLDLGSEAALFFVQSTGTVAGLKETNDCAGIASVYVGATGDSAATFSVKPLRAGSCHAHVIDETGATVSVPVTVH